MTTARRGPRGRWRVPAAAVLLLVLAGCGSDGSADDAAASTGATAAAGGLVVRDAWVRATDESMTAAFGVVSNGTATDCTVVSAETSASEHTELHEVVMVGGTSTMRPKEGGFAVPADGELALEPGGAHVMMMGLADPLQPGDDVTVTLVCADGRTVEAAAQVRESGAGDEKYQPTPTVGTTAG